MLDGTLHISGDLAAKAYLVTRLPATYGAVRDAMAKLAEFRPDFQPKSLLDAGSGPGTVLWAAADCWPGLENALLLESSAAIRKWGEILAASGRVRHVTWQAADIVGSLAVDEPRDLVCLAYVLSELPDDIRPRLIDDLWHLTAHTLLIVEPGTPRGWQRILAAREQMIANGAHIIVPCPHHEACPIAAPDWCHFSRRVARSRLHRLAKEAEVPWEDEKFIYLAASRHRGLAVEARILVPPRASKGRIDLQLCCADGTLKKRTVSMRDGAAYKIARRRNWGDAIENSVGDRQSRG
jgi:ribosomal protein RSM22 (predicted rRNA methylase)